MTPGADNAYRLKERRFMQNARHFVIMAVLVVVVAILTYLGLNSLGLMPVEASTQSIQIDWLFDLEVKMIAFFFALIMVPLGYSLVVFRRKEGDETDAPHIEGNTGLEITWTAIPLIIVIALGIIGANNLRQVRAVDPQAMQINVVAFQWGWRFEYPQGGFTSNKLYLPVNKQVVLKMQSQDVIHSFWVPEFRVKQDVVPGRVEDYRITPDRIGEYKVRCAEICGTSHAYMEAAVIVVSQADYDKWVTDQTVAAQAAALASVGKPDATRGEKLYQESGCKACHSLDGAKGVGPTWKGLFGSQVKLADGSSVTADEAYLTESIRLPGAKTVEGFPANAMPNFGYLTDGQVADLVSFIETLK
jgi:cytochrome c oxidase subunit 2